MQRGNWGIKLADGRTHLFSDVVVNELEDGHLRVVYEAAERDWRTRAAYAPGSWVWAKLSLRQASKAVTDEELRLAKLGLNPGRIITQDELVDLSQSVSGLLGGITHHYLCPSITKTMRVVRENFDVVIEDSK